MGCRGSQVRILSPRPNPSKGWTSVQPFFIRACGSVASLGGEHRGAEAAEVGNILGSGAILDLREERLAQRGVVDVRLQAEGEDEGLQALRRLLQALFLR